MKKQAFMALVGCVAAISTLRGDIIPSFAGTLPSGGNTVWSYHIDIASGAQVTAGDFFTIYDFGPFIAGSNTQQADWTFSSSLVTAPPSGTLPPDDPNILNLTWTYTGTTPIPAGSVAGLFSVTVATPFQEHPPTRNSYFAAQASRAPGLDTGKLNNIGRIQVPVPIPEPTTLSLLALAGVGSALRAIRRRK
jgi:PEP-CTERM motif